MSARTFAELLSDVSEAAFECGEWDGNSNTDYDESHNALENATAAITAYHARLTAQVEALRGALRSCLEMEISHATDCPAYPDNVGDCDCDHRFAVEEARAALAASEVER